MVKLLGGFLIVYHIEKLCKTYFSANLRTFSVSKRKHCKHQQRSMLKNHLGKANNIEQIILVL